MLAVDPPQHISWTWDWEGEPLGVQTVVAFDLIDHAERTHLTVRHVGFRSRAQQQLHDALWRYWFARLVRAAKAEAAVRRESKAGGTLRATLTGARHRLASPSPRGQRSPFKAMAGNKPDRVARAMDRLVTP